MAVILRTTGNVVYTDYGRQCPVPFKTPETREVEEIFCGLPPGIEPFLWSAGSEYFRRGSCSPSRQAEAIFTLGHYLFYGDPSKDILALGFGYEAEREWVIEHILIDEKTTTNKAKSWSQRASRCVPVMLDSTETVRLRSSVVALKSFLFSAPTRNDAMQLETIIDQVYDELLIRTLGPLAEQ
ncbi:MAG TPA: hypothetical protein V6C97_25020 [Oculatellaceae cyanobacterium]